MMVGARLGRFGLLGLVGIEPGEVHQRGLGPLLHDLLVQLLVRAEERLGAGRVILDREHVPGDAELLVGHHALLGGDPRAVDGRAVGAAQVA